MKRKSLSKTSTREDDTQHIDDPSGNTSPVPVGFDSLSNTRDPGVTYFSKTVKNFKEIKSERQDS